MGGIERRRRRSRSTGDRTGSDEPATHRPSPHDLADRSGASAATPDVHDPDETAPTTVPSPTTFQRPAPVVTGSVAEPAGEPDRDDTTTERGLRGLVGGGSSQVSTTAALR